MSRAQPWYVDFNPRPHNLHVDFNPRPHHLHVDFNPRPHHLHVDFNPRPHHLHVDFNPRPLFHQTRTHLGGGGAPPRATSLLRVSGDEHREAIEVEHAGEGQGGIGMCSVQRPIRPD